MNLPLIRLLVAKDWQLFEKQLAAHVAAGILALALIGMAKSWSFYLGSLLLIIIMVAAACFAVSTSLINERRERTLAFVMSLPVTPLDFYLAKMAGNLLTFGVPFGLITAGAVGVVMFTPLPDGLVLLALLLSGHILLAFAVSLAVVLQVEAEGWNLFVMIGSMVLINPFLAGIGQVAALQTAFRAERLSWPWEALAILGAQVLLSLLLLAWTTWRHTRKPTFF